jgi:hypothetical protein
MMFVKLDPGVTQEEVTIDLSEAARRKLIDEGTPAKLFRELGEAEETWDTQSLQEAFDVLGFLAPYCSVIRKSDGKKGTIMFVPAPRVYFYFRPV